MEIVSARRTLRCGIEAASSPCANKSECDVGANVLGKQKTSCRRESGPAAYFACDASQSVIVVSASGAIVSSIVPNSFCVPVSACWKK